MESGNNGNSNTGKPNYESEYDRVMNNPINKEIATKNASYEESIKTYGDEMKKLDDIRNARIAEQSQISPESFMSKFIRPVIEVITKYIMENYLTEDNINAVSNLMQSIVEEFFERLDDIANHNPRIAASVSQLKAMVAKAISKEARRTVVPESEGIEMQQLKSNKEPPATGGSRRKRRQTKKRRGSKRRRY